jgi:hypothetical protein
MDIDRLKRAFLDYGDMLRERRIEPKPSREDLFVEN